MKVRNKQLLAAALAGVTAGVMAARDARAEEKGDVNCYGINGCGAHAKCAVSQADLDAVKKLLGSKEFGSRFGKSEAHGCGAHASCGAASSILNWTPTSPEQCAADGGIVIEEKKGKKVAKKA